MARLVTKSLSRIVKRNCMVQGQTRDIAKFRSKENRRLVKLCLASSQRVRLIRIMPGGLSLSKGYSQLRTLCDRKKMSNSKLSMFQNTWIKLCNWGAHSPPTQLFLDCIKYKVGSVWPRNLPRIRVIATCQHIALSLKMATILRYMIRHTNLQWTVRWPFSRSWIRRHFSRHIRSQFSKGLSPVRANSPRWTSWG